jgi:glycine betaine/proline transport system substrate-binding protein
VVYAGSEPALIQAFRQGEQNKKPVIGYFYAPQWFLSEVPLVKVNLPPTRRAVTPTRRRSPATTRSTTSTRSSHAKFAQANGPAYKLVKAFNWTNDDQNRGEGDRRGQGGRGESRPAVGRRQP